MGVYLSKRRNGYLEIRWARISAHRYAARGRQSVFRDSRSWRLFLHSEYPYRRPNPQPADRRTTVIQRRGSHAYLYTGVGQRKSQLICVDLTSGSILDEIELPGIASDDRVLGLWEDCIYTMTFEYKSKRYYDQVKNAVYSCIALD